MTFEYIFKWVNQHLNIGSGRVHLHQVQITNDSVFAVGILAYRKIKGMFSRLNIFI